MVTTTGSGWVDPALVDTFEYLSGGNCGTRVLYMMHPSDPIVWWSPHLIFSKPD